MHVFRADTEDAATRLIRTLADTGLEPQLERHGPRRIYVVVNSTRPDIVNLALSVGPTVRRVPTLDELHPGRWRRLLIDGLVTSAAVGVAAAVEGHLGGPSTRAEITAARRAAHRLAASGGADPSKGP